MGLLASWPSSTWDVVGRGDGSQYWSIDAIRPPLGLQCENIGGLYLRQCSSVAGVELLRVRIQQFGDEFIPLLVEFVPLDADGLIVVHSVYADSRKTTQEEMELISIFTAVDSSGRTHELSRHTNRSRFGAELPTEFQYINRGSERVPATIDHVPNGSFRLVVEIEREDALILDGLMRTGQGQYELPGSVHR